MLRGSLCLPMARGQGLGEGHTLGSAPEALMGPLREGPGLASTPPPSHSTLRLGVWDFRGPARRLCEAGGTVDLSEWVSSLLKPAQAWGRGVTTMAGKARELAELGGSLHR